MKINMEKRNNKLINNGTALNLSANDVLDLSLSDIAGLEKERINNIQRGNR